MSDRSDILFFVLVKVKTGIDILILVDLKFLTSSRICLCPPAGIPIREEAAESSPSLPKFEKSVTFCESG
jgi:hypothetical protein